MVRRIFFSVDTDAHGPYSHTSIVSVVKRIFNNQPPLYVYWKSITYKQQRFVCAFWYL